MKRRIALTALSALTVIGVARFASAGPQPVDLAAAVNYQHWLATGNWLAGDHALDVYAQTLAAKMADAGIVTHSDISVLLGCQWGVVAENIGVGPSVNLVVAAFMASPSHAANITGPYTHLGSGLVERDGRLWAVTIFAQ